ncbi:cytochrome P450 [Stappia taiwanensis]|uniref:Cytochrome P450 n=1 Tax=Stappia taiwanensis TaxID=992267 RepID=A0A838XRQ4_9HYPH|nr:cytochrome P450 [Stappia taiwanensis]MBA4613125.1 cytochrome P450 [Stappia taiwanensis]GGE80294.1 cytochrome P450 [Stappia taiwanensis]
MIHVPKLALNGTKASLGSPIRACRSPETNWPAEILDEPLCIGEKAGKTVALLAAPEEIKRVIVEREAEFPKWLPIYRHSAARETGTGTIFAANDQDWLPIRRAINPLFHSSRWALLVEVARHVTLQACASSPVDGIERFFTAISVDVVYRTLVGDGAEGETPYDLPGMAEGLVRMQHAGDLRGAMRHIHDLAVACEARGPGPEAIAGVDLAGATPPRPRPLEEPYLHDNRLALLYAGQETTALTMSWCFWILGQDPELQSRLRHEVREAVAEAGSLSTDAITTMKTLFAVFRETMRLLSPSAATVRTAAQETELCGRKVPQGSVIVIPIYAVHRHRSLWDDPDSFDAGRFLRPLKHPMAFLPFAAGRHTCVAARSVMYEMATVLAVLLDRFAWTTSEADRMGLTSKLVLSPTADMKVELSALTPRFSQVAGATG